MAHTIEGNDTIGYRVIDDTVGALTGRKKTEADARAAAGLEQKPRGRAAKKADPVEEKADESPSDES